MINLDNLKELSKNTLMETLNIEFVSKDENSITLKMPVTEKVHQPFGILHGGASVALAETTGSLLSILNIDHGVEKVRGLEISANHIKSKKSGFVFARAEFLHKGRTTHISEIKITDENNDLVCFCKMTNIVLSK